MFNNILRDLWSYTKTCFQLSYSFARRSADNLFGLLLCGLASILLAPWIREFFGLEGDLLEQFTSWTGVLFVVVLFFVLRFVFIAPFLVYRGQRKEIAQVKAEIQHNGKRSQDELDELRQKLLERTAQKHVEERNKPVTLHDAVRYIQEEAEWGKGKTDKEIVQELLDLAIGSTITVSGQHKWKFNKQVYNHSEVIKPETLSRFRYEKEHGDFGTPALIEIVGDGKAEESEDKDEQSFLLLGSQPNIYYNPTVKIDEIRRHFDRK